MSYKNPVISTNDERVTSPFGWRVLNGKREHHDGIDMVDKSNLQLKKDGVAVIAYADGKVKAAGYGASVGYYVDIAHEGKILTRYFHMRSGSMTVKAGDTVKRGQKLGVMGTTGNSTGVHLHFGVKENSTAYNNGIYVNPESYLRGAKSIGGSVGNIVQALAVNAPGDTQSSAELKVGDKVRILPTAQKYVTGEAIPARVKGATDTIMQFSKDGSSVLLKGIYSWVRKSDVVKM